MTHEQPMLRTSERLMFNRCRMQHHFAYDLTLRPRLESPALRFGTLIHAALEKFYLPRPKPAKPTRLSTLFEIAYHKELKATMKEWPQWRDEDDEWHSYLELGTELMRRYQVHWEENDKEYVVLSTEQTFQLPIEIPPGEEPLPPTSPHTYVGTIDKIVYHRPTKRLLLSDYKTMAANQSVTAVGHLALDEQAGAYLALGPAWIAERAPAALQARIRRRLRALPPSVRAAVTDDDGRLRFDGILYDHIRKGIPNDDRPQNAEGQCLNKDGSVSKQQPAKTFHREPIYRDQAERANVIQRIYEDALEIGLVRSGEMRLKKSPDRFHCQMCAFKDVCELHESGLDWQAMAKATMTTWDPFDAHEAAIEAKESSR